MPTNRIATLRRAAGMLQVDIASRLRVSERTVDRWERGQVQIPDRQKLALAEVFGVGVSFLMGWDDGANGTSEQAA